jgi:hypothetical protein
VRAALGKAFGELGLFSDAVTHYRKALTAEAAQVHIEAAEQMCNLMARQATRLREEAHTLTDQQEAQQRIEHARALVNGAKSRLTALIQALGETAERCSLLGSIAKREALWATTPSEKAAHLEEIRKAYKRAVSIGQETHDINPYPLLNWLTADTVLALLDQPGETDDVRGEQLQLAAAAATSRDQRQPNFWDAVSVIDARLLAHISDGTLADHAQDLIDCYLSVRRRGSPREFRSVLEHLDFLITMIGMTASSGNGATRSPFITLLEEIKHGITS